MLWTTKLRGAVAASEAGGDPGGVGGRAREDRRQAGVGRPPVLLQVVVDRMARFWESAIAGRPWRAPSQAPATVPLPRMKARLALSPMFIPLTTASGGDGQEVVEARC